MDPGPGSSPRAGGQNVSAAARLQDAARSFRRAIRLAWSVTIGATICGFGLAFAGIAARSPWTICSGLACYLVTLPVPQVVARRIRTLSRSLLASLGDRVRASDLPEMLDLVGAGGSVAASLPIIERLLGELEPGSLPVLGTPQRRVLYGALWGGALSRVNQEPTFYEVQRRLVPGVLRLIEVMNYPDGLDALERAKVWAACKELRPLVAATRETMRERAKAASSEASATDPAGLEPTAPPRDA